MKRLILSFAGLLLLSAGCQYGPMQDYSRFTSAYLVQEDRTVVFTFHDFAYKPAAGIAAFPDGGIPHYVRDQSFLCSFDRTKGTLKKLMTGKNKEWCNGQGVLHIVTARGNAVLASQSGQKRTDLDTYLTRHYLINIATGKSQTFDLSADLGKHGRAPGPLYLVDDTGTLLIMTKAASKGKKAPSSPAEVPEIWVRCMDGRYVKVVATAHYEETVNNEVIYWNPGDRQFYGFDLATGKTRRLDNYRTRGYQDIKQGVLVRNSGSSIEFGTKTGDTWNYTPLPVTAEMVRGL